MEKLHSGYVLCSAPYLQDEGTVPRTVMPLAPEWSCHTDKFCYDCQLAVTKAKQKFDTFLGRFTRKINWNEQTNIKRFSVEIAFLFL